MQGGAVKVEPLAAIILYGKAVNVLLALVAGWILVAVGFSLAVFLFAVKMRQP